VGPRGPRRLAVADLHRLPGDRPDLETALRAGELVTAVRVPAEPAWDTSVYVDLRDRASYAFALASAAVALRLQPDGTVDDVRVVLGGLAAVPWRCPAVEDALRGRRLDPGRAVTAAASCLEGADVDDVRAFTVDLGRRTVVRALLDGPGAGGRWLIVAGRTAFQIDVSPPPRTAGTQQHPRQPADGGEGEVGVALGHRVVARVIADQGRGLVHVADPR